MKEIRVAIVGGGPAGLQAAISLSRLGIYSTVFEEHSNIGLPIQCGEGLSIHAFNDFSIPVEPSEIWTKVHKRCKLVFPGNKAIYGDIQAYMIQRDKFDYTKWRKNLFHGLDGKEISKKAMEFQNKLKNEVESGLRVKRV